VLCDIEVLKECLKDNLGDVTFQVLGFGVQTPTYAFITVGGMVQEAYDRTKRILNVSVNSNFEVSRV
jgi:hypothetical protein